MSSVGALSCKERSRGIYFWVVILAVRLLGFDANFYLTAVKTNVETSARGLVANIQVLSQQIATYSAEAVDGGFEAFEELEATQQAIQSRINTLRTGDAALGLPSYESAPRVGEE